MKMNKLDQEGEQLCNPISHCKDMHQVELKAKNLMCFSAKELVQIALKQK